VGPRIIPVNYLLRDGALVFRTTPYSELGSYGPGNEVAFEIDHFDHASHQGWSVVALGRLQRVAASEELDDLRRNRGPEPWAGGHRGLYLTLEWREVSGRRIGSDWVHLMRPAI
jgi:nitroimidazol reductase NimA-like FMN-containing flavoprotein (pyridoxamine 5'-phosphate oxidase superfamily)